MSMCRKIAAGEYQIGQWTVRKLGRDWVAEAPGIASVVVLTFPSLAAAHLQLTGEPRK